MREMLDLFLAFMRIGGFTFGGGYAMLPMLQREVVERRGWATDEGIADYFAIGQCTPGVIAVNTATFVGNKVRGISGAVIATIGVVVPSVVIITIIAAFISNFAELQVVRDAFAGVRVCVCVLILNAVIKLWKSSVVDLPTIGIFALVAVGSVFLDVSPVIFVVVSAVAGIAIQVIRGRKVE